VAPTALARVRAVPPRLVLALGWLVLVVYAYPGQLGDESFAYLRQARTRFFSDGYPPAISALWRVLEVLVAGPTGMFLVQSAVFTLGAHAVLRRALAPRAAAWTTAGLLVFPPVLVSVAVISSDGLMAGFLLAGAIGLVSERRAARLGGLAALFVATAVHTSALVATLPLLVVLFTWRPDARGVRRVAHAVAAWLAITAAALGVNVPSSTMPACATSSPAPASSSRRACRPPPAHATARRARCRSCAATGRPGRSRPTVLHPRRPSVTRSPAPRASSCARIRARTSGTGCRWSARCCGSRPITPRPS
jgi:hypothetical protein